MHWVLQDHFFNDAAFQLLQAGLAAQDTPCTVVQLTRGRGTIEPDLDISGPVYAHGGSGLCAVAQAKGWVPGYFGENLDYRLLMRHHGHHMLNHDARIQALKDVHPEEPILFFRPVDDLKRFSGKVLGRDEFTAWRDALLANPGEGHMSSLRGEDLVVVATPKTLYAEYRFQVIDGTVVTGSSYKRGNQPYFTDQIDDSIHRFAQARADSWCPNRGFCLDIADTPNGLKVVEINAINSSSFYACDIGKFIQAINSLAR